MSNRRLGHAINRLRRQRGEARLRTHADNLSASLPDHHAPCRLARKKCSFQIHRNSQIKIFFAHIFRRIFRPQPRVVHQNVQSPELPRRIFHRSADLLQLGHVHLQRQRPPSHRAYLRRQSAVGLHVSQPQRDIRSRMSHRKRNRTTQSPRRSRNQRHLPRQIKTRKVHFRLSSPAAASISRPHTPSPSP